MLVLLDNIFIQPADVGVLQVVHLQHRALELQDAARNLSRPSAQALPIQTEGSMSLDTTQASFARPI